MDETRLGLIPTGKFTRCAISSQQQHSQYFGENLEALREGVGE